MGYVIDMVSIGNIVSFCYCSFMFCNCRKMVLWLFVVECVWSFYVLWRRVLIVVEVCMRKLGWIGVLE